MEKLVVFKDNHNIRKTVSQGFITQTSDGVGSIALPTANGQYVLKQEGDSFSWSTYQVAESISYVNPQWFKTNASGTTFTGIPVINVQGNGYTNVTMPNARGNFMLYHDGTYGYSFKVYLEPTLKDLITNYSSNRNVIYMPYANPAGNQAAELDSTKNATYNLKVENGQIAFQEVAAKSTGIESIQNAEVWSGVASGVQALTSNYNTITCASNISVTSGKNYLITGDLYLSFEDVSLMDSMSNSFTISLDLGYGSTSSYHQIITEFTIKNPLTSLMRISFSKVITASIDLSATTAGFSWKSSIALPTKVTIEKSPKSTIQLTCL